MTGPLDGVRVVELGSYIAGPFAGQILADLGADVLKIEPPGGDGLRSWGMQAPSGSSWWSYVQNRGKRLAGLDLEHADGPGVVRRLLPGADILVENFRPGTLERWGLGPEQISAEFPHLIYVAVSGYGLTGPNRDLPGFGNVAESRGGIRYVTGYPDRPPVRTGVSLGDAAAGLYAVIGGLASLYARERDPRRHGEVVDIALTDAVCALSEAALTEYLHAGVVRERTGNQLLRAAPSNVYRTADDRWVALGANSDGIFQRLAHAMDRPQLASDPRYRDNQARVAHADELDEVIAEWVAGHTALDVTAIAARAGVPAGPVQSAADMARDPQFRDREMIIEVSDPEDPTLGPVASVGVVPKLWHRKQRPTTTGGAVGRDTKAIADWAGLSPGEYRDLVAAHVLVEARSQPSQQARQATTDGGPSHERGT